MSAQTKETTQAPITLPAGIALEDLVSAVSRGVGEALAAQGDVTGHAFTRGPAPVAVTLVVLCPVPPPQDEGRPFDRGLLPGGR